MLRILFLYSCYRPAQPIYMSIVARLPFLKLFVKFKHKYIIGSDNNIKITNYKI